jgi:release factor glutamine methyltransferase
VDLGVGSGAIALSVAQEAPAARVWGTDASSAALAVARANLAGLGSAAAARVRLAEGRWFDALPQELRGQVDLLVSNPPYVAEHEAAALPAEVGEWEPRDALVAGPTGLEAIAEIVAGAPAWLARPGALVVEIAPHQAEAAGDLARAAGLEQVDVRPDLVGRRRVLVGRF